LNVSAVTRCVVRPSPASRGADPTHRKTSSDRDLVSVARRGPRAGWLVFPDWPWCWLTLAALLFVLVLPSELARTYRRRRDEGAERD
jgi:hypothetical protein